MKRVKRFSNRLLKKCHCERFSAKQSLKIKGLLRQKAPRNDNCGVFQHPAKLSRRRLLLFLLGALALAQWRCGENPLQPDVRGPNDVWITSSGFDPATLTVALGTTVTWTNKDNVKHDVTSGRPGNVENAFDPSRNLSTNETHQVIFDARGTFNYFCLTHGSGHAGGRIVVQ
jgi:plastocyanin